MRSEPLIQDLDHRSVPRKPLSLERRFRDLSGAIMRRFGMQESPAVLWTDTAEFRNANYHQRSDTP